MDQTSSNIASVTLERRVRTSKALNSGSLTPGNCQKSDHIAIMLTSCCEVAGINSFSVQQMLSTQWTAVSKFLQVHKAKMVFNWDPSFSLLVYTYERCEKNMKPVPVKPLLMLAEAIAIAARPNPSSRLTSHVRPSYSNNIESLDTILLHKTNYKKQCYYAG